MSSGNPLHRSIGSVRPSPPLWTGRAPLQRVLAAGLGAFLGVLLSLGLVLMTGMHAWFFVISIPAAAFAGYWKGDRALVGMLKAVTHFWS